MNVLIIEDEPLAANKLRQLLQRIEPGIRILATLETVEESILWFRQNRGPDLIFLDIQLDDGICFEIFDVVEVRAPIIFTTAYDQYAIKAFEVNSINYLLKPIDKEALARSIDKYRALLEDRGPAKQKIDRLYEALVTGYKTRFFVRAGARFHSISVNDIECCFVRDKAAFIRTREGRNYAMDQSLDQLSSVLDPKQFFRINRNYVVHIDAVREIHSYSASRLRLKLQHTDNTDLIVSREKVPAFKEWMDR